MTLRRGGVKVQPKFRDLHWYRVKFRALAMLLHQILLVGMSKRTGEREKSFAVFCLYSQNLKTTKMTAYVPGTI